MADIDLSHPHGMTLDEAKTKVEQIVNDVHTEFPSLVDSVSWNADKTEAQVKGKAFSGSFGVDATNVTIAINLKLMARPFKGKVEGKIQDRIGRYFA